MQWAFVHYPATTGVNSGNVSYYSQIDRFGLQNAAYDGGYGALDGVDYLDTSALLLSKKLKALHLSILVLTITSALYAMKL